MSVESCRSDIMGILLSSDIKFVIVDNVLTLANLY